MSKKIHSCEWPLAADALADLMTPALVVDLGRVDRNIESVVSMVGGPDRWRPHVKTSKIPEVFERFVARGVGQFKCATTREAACLLQTLRKSNAECGDVLVAYPLLGPALGRLSHLASEYPEYSLSVLCEDERICEQLPASVGVFVDVNPGMNRTGVPLEAGGRIHHVAQRAGSAFRGLHFYDGHLSQSDPAARRAAIHAGYSRLIELAHELSAGGIPVGEIVTSGTPAFADAVAFDEFGQWNHRVSPGTVVYHDMRTAQENPALALEPAALVYSRVISHPCDGRVTCDAGSKSIAAEAGDPCCVALGRPELQAGVPNEEHLPFNVAPGAPRPERGDLLVLFPRHVCPTVNLADEAVLVERGAVRDIVPVAARGHELRG